MNDAVRRLREGDEGAHWEPEVLEAARAKQRERIDRLDVEADPARLETELALIAQKLDIAEWSAISLETRHRRLEDVDLQFTEEALFAVEPFASRKSDFNS